MSGGSCKCDNAMLTEYIGDFIMTEKDLVILRFSRVYSSRRLKQTDA